MLETFFEVNAAQALASGEEKQELGTIGCTSWHVYLGHELELIKKKVCVHDRLIHFSVLKWLSPCWKFIMNKCEICSRKISPKEVDIAHIDINLERKDDLIPLQDLSYGSIRHLDPSIRKAFVLCQSAAIKILNDGLPKEPRIER